MMESHFDEDYVVLSGVIPVAKWEKHSLIILNERLLPLFLKRDPNIFTWLISRAIDSKRSHARLLKKALRLTERDDLSTVLHVN